MILSRLRRVIRGLLAAGAVLSGAAALVAAVLSQALVATVRQPTHAPPVGYTESRLRSSDGLSLRVWWRAPAPGRAPRPSVLVVHGHGDSLESFTNAAERLSAHGHGVLLLDLRGHGGSDGGHTTLGAREAGDVRVALAHLRTRGQAGTGLALMGTSMGAVAVLLAAVDQPDVRALVAEAPYDTYRATVGHHARLLYGLPEWLPLIPLTIRVAEWRAGFDADAADCVAAAARVPAALLLIAGGADTRMPVAVVQRVAAAHRGRTELWVVPGAGHAQAAAATDYWPRVLAFLDFATR